MGLSACLALAGCSGGDPAMTKAQEDAARHPTADPNWKGPSPEAQEKMQQSIAEFNAKHKNDKVEFKSGN